MAIAGVFIAYIAILFIAKFNAPTNTHKSTIPRHREAAGRGDPWPLDCRATLAMTGNNGNEGFIEMPIRLIS